MRSCIKGYFVRCAVPSAAELPSLRLLFVAIEATLSFHFWTMQSQKKDYGMAGFCLCSHSAMWECSCKGRSHGGSAAVTGAARQQRHDSSSFCGTPRAPISAKYTPATTLNQAGVVVRITMERLRIECPSCFGCFFQMALGCIISRQRIVPAEHNTKG